MKSLRSTLLLIAALAFVVMSCSKPKPSHAIPEQASFVMKVNAANLLLKAVSWTDLGKLFGTDSVQADSTNKLDIQNSGLDFTVDAYMFALNSQPGQVNDMQVYAVMALEDAGKFESWLKKAYPGTSVVEKNGAKYATAFEGMVVSWTEKLVLAKVNNKQAVSEAEVDKMIGFLNQKETAALENNSIAFDKFNKATDQVGVYLNTKNLSGQGNGETYTSLDFQAGKVVMEGETIAGNGDNMGMVPSKIKPAFVANWPAAVNTENCMIMGMSLEPDSLTEYLTANAANPGIKAVNDGLVNYQTNLGELLQLWDGQIGISVDMPANAADVNFLTMQGALLLGVRDMALTKAILGRLVEAGMLQDAGNGEFVLPLFGVLKAKLEDKRLAITYGAKAFDGKQQPEVTALVGGNGNQSAMKLKIAPIRQLLKNIYAQGEADVIPFANVDYMEITTKGEGKNSTLSGQIVMTDKEKNAMRAIVEDLSRVMLANKMQRQNQQKEVEEAMEGMEEADTAAKAIQ